MNLTDFLLARIAEDEAGVDDGRFAWWFRMDQPQPFTRNRLRAECEAKRRIVERHTHDDDRLPWWPRRPSRLGDCPTLRDLALPYSGHPDFNPSWGIE